jgi:hypothetical protein
LKIISLIRRRPDISRAQFREYYETQRALLGACYFPFRKYVRNHLLSSIPADPGFDVLLECWIDRNQLLKTLSGETERLFAEDEARFMNAPPRPGAVEVVEHLVMGPPRRTDARGQRKFAWLIASGGGEQTEFLAWASLKFPRKTRRK